MLQIRSERVKKTILSLSMEFFLLGGILLAIDTYKQKHIFLIWL